MDRKFEDMERKFERFREDTFELFDTIVERIEDGNKDIAHFCRNTAQTMDLLALNITTSVSAFKRRKQQCGQDTDSAMTAERTFGGGQLTAAAQSDATSAARGGEFGAKANNFRDCVPSTTSPICPNDKVSLSIAIRQGRLDNPGVDSAIKSNCEKSDKALFYEHAESLQSLLHDFPRKLRNECTDRTSINIAIYDFEARFMSTLDEMNSVMNALRSSIDAE
ncbi:hypothetical protein niasHS_010412 [Heterodera schachtii]|uniref:Uncharacterized protein n=1 Tax=Heterodera schachtii TaxID=97005 RepID=A0ABD2J672_HETSC